jgi:hypothetical protein
LKFKIILAFVAGACAISGLRFMADGNIGLGLLGLALSGWNLLGALNEA